MEGITESFAALQAWMPWAAAMPTVEEERAFLRHADEGFTEGRDFQFAMRHAATGRFLGGCGLHASRAPHPEIGYWVRTSETGRGYATEAARALTAAAFAHLPAVDRIEIRCGVGNHASAAVAAKLGYVLDRVEAGTMIWNKNRSNLV